MDIIKELIHALWQQDFETLANPSLVWTLYILLFMILFLENGLLPAAFLPGDSLLIPVGVLIAKGTMGFPLTIVILTVAASPGGSVTYRADGSAIRERCKAGFRTCRPTTISARITCSTATGFPPCWSAASPSCAPCCQPSPACPA